MLQALTLDAAPAPAKNRSAAGSSSDPGEAVFAGMVAQATYASSQPSRDAGTSQRTEAREPGRTETAAIGNEAREPSAKTAQEPAETGASDPAKAAVTEAPEKTETKETGTSAASAAPQPAATGLPGAPLPQAAPADAASAPGQVAATAPAPQAPQAPAQAETPAAPALPVRLEQKVDGDDGSTDASTRKPALTELLYVPKAEMETPPLHPKEAKAGQASAKTTGPAPETLGETAAAETPAEGVEEAVKPSATPSSHPADEPAPAVLAKPEAPAPTAHQPQATASETAVAAGAPSVKAVAGPAQAEQAAAGRPSPVLAQVEGSIRWILQNKAQGAELQLHPESLGRVVVQLRVEGQEVHARLWVSEPSSLSALQTHRTFLESSLKEQGLNLSSFDLHSGARGDGAQTAPQDHPGTPALRELPHLEVLQEMPIEIALDGPDARRIEVYA